MEAISSAVPADIAERQYDDTPWSVGHEQARERQQSKHRMEIADNLAYQINAGVWDEFREYLKPDLRRLTAIWFGRTRQEFLDEWESVVDRIVGQMAEEWDPEASYSEEWK